MKPVRGRMRWLGALWIGLVAVASIALYVSIDGGLWTTDTGPNLATVRHDASCAPETLGRQCNYSEDEQAAIRAASLGRHSEHSTAEHTTSSGEGEAGISDRQRTLAQSGIAVLATLVVALPLAVLGKSSWRTVWSLAERRPQVAMTLGTVLLVGGITPAAAPTGTTGTGASVPPPFSVPLAIPPVLTGSDIRINMAETDVQLLPDGPPTTMWTYNGRFPGPTIRRPSGSTTRVTFTNNLPVPAGQATVHHHGSHSRPSEDGQPDAELIPTGGRRTYTYRHVEDGGPERAVTQWYHDHRMDVTGRNVWNGLAGMFILDDAFDAALPLPDGRFDVPLVLTDRTFDANNQIPYTFNLISGTLGDTLLVNGRPQPFFAVGDRKYRLRILNASNSRPYAMALSNGQPLIQIGTDSGLLPAPVARDFIVVQPAERVEVVVDFAGLLGQNVVLQNLAGVGTTADIMQFQVTRDLTDDSEVPATLRPVPDFGEVDVTRNWTLELTNNETFTINGQPFDSGRIDAAPRLGDTERWVFTNNSEQTHAIHIHDVDWRLESRNGAPPPVYEDGLKETWEIPPGQTFSVITRFTDHVGPYVFHCHILEHEDLAMMAQFEVQPALQSTAGDTRQPPL